MIQKKFTVCWFHATNSYTISMGQKIHGFQIKFSVIDDVFTNWCQVVDDNVNTIYSFNCFFPLLLFLLGKTGLSNFCYPSIICFGHQLSMLAAKCTCVQYMNCDYQAAYWTGLNAEWVLLLRSNTKCDSFTLTHTHIKIHVCNSGESLTHIPLQICSFSPTTFY